LPVHLAQVSQIFVERKPLSGKAGENAEKRAKSLLRELGASARESTD